jgi:hypothetical protein
MPLDNPAAGFGYATEFQSSGLPWLTSSVAPAVGSPLEFDFPKVTRFVCVSNTDSNVAHTLSFGFTQAGVQTSSNKYVLLGGQNALFEIRCTQMFLQGEAGTPTFSILAGLTTVDAKMMPVLTGSQAGVQLWQGVG